MNILILSGSPRKNGNTDLLVEAFAKVQRAIGVERVGLAHHF